MTWLVPDLPLDSCLPVVKMYLSLYSDSASVLRYCTALHGCALIPDCTLTLPFIPVNFCLAVNDFLACVLTTLLFVD